MKPTKYNILWVIIAFGYLGFALFSLNELVEEDLKNQYEHIKDEPYDLFTLASLVPFQDDFITYRKTRFNETWVYTHGELDGLIQRVG